MGGAVLNVSNILRESFFTKKKALVNLVITRNNKH